ncbi:MAG: hypothetical protein JWM36_4368 [Hyphomicrobiales bacterium]|nr:hypothetical protein [Hyphomicrobiales bacterium]
MNAPPLDANPKPTMLGLVIGAPLGAALWLLIGLGLKWVIS